MLVTFLDAEINAAYARDRVAEIRAMSDLPRGTRALISDPGPWSRLRRRVGMGMVAVGQRIGGMAESGRMSSPTAASRLS